MAGLFAKLRAAVETGEPATPATLATPPPAMIPHRMGSSGCSGSSSGADSENMRRIEPDPAATEADRIEALAEALTEKAGAFIGDGIDQAEADRLAVVVVQCRSCAHYRPNRTNPEAGAGICVENAWPLSRSARTAQRPGLIPWPLAPRLCETFQKPA